MELSQEEEINRLRVLNDIYKEENERLKYEYRVLNDIYKEENERLKYEYRVLQDKLTDVQRQLEISKSHLENANKNILYRILKRIKRKLDSWIKK